MVPSDQDDPRTLVFEVTDQLAGPGRYRVEWDYTRGQDGLDILSTSLCTSPTGDAGDMTPVATDEHHAFTGAGDRDNRYMLVLDQVTAGARYFVVGTVFDQRDFDTYGDVWMPLEGGP